MTFGAEVRTNDPTYPVRRSPYALVPNHDNEVVHDATGAVVVDTEPGRTYFGPFKFLPDGRQVNMDALGAGEFLPQGVDQFSILGGATLGAIFGLVLARDSRVVSAVVGTLLGGVAGMYVAGVARRTATLTRS